LFAYQYEALIKKSKLRGNRRWTYYFSGHLVLEKVPRQN
jgi:hypothetical protein